MLARERTISEIIGRPPMKATARLATPVAHRSLSRSEVRFWGSRASTATTLSNDSTVPTKANMAMYLRETGEKTAEKSGSVTASSRRPGSVTSNAGPTCSCQVMKS